MLNIKLNSLAPFFLFASLFLGGPQTFAETKATPPAKPATGAEEADVKKIREKYWARGNEAEMGVVQNRLFPKRQRFELGLGAGTLNGDPFLSSSRYGGSLGYHFTEFLSVHAQYWSVSTGPSSALTTLISQTGQTANTNYPKSYFLVDGRASLLYGKLSLLGSAILYFDSFFSIGAGQIKTESGSNLMLAAGLGQQIHISRVVSLNLDYKLLYFKETIVGKNPGDTANLGKVIGTRTNYSNAVTLSVSIFLNPFGA